MYHYPNVNDLAKSRGKIVGESCLLHTVIEGVGMRGFPEWRIFQSSSDFLPGNRVLNVTTLQPFRDDIAKYF